MSIPTDSKKIRATIRQYERNFEKDPNYRDGSGSRFLIGPYYLLLGDVDGALRHYRWFEAKFPDSMDEPFHGLTWSLAMFRSGQAEESIYRLRRAHFANTYLIPAILEIPYGQPDLRRGGNWEEQEYVMEGPTQFLAVWQSNDRSWLKEVWQSPGFQAFVQTHSELEGKLAKEPAGPARTVLVEAIHALRRRAVDRPKLVLVKSLSDHPG